MAVFAFSSSGFLTAQLLGAAFTRVLTDGCGGIELGRFSYTRHQLFLSGSCGGPPSPWLCMEMTGDSRPTTLILTLGGEAPGPCAGCAAEFEVLAEDGSLLLRDSLRTHPPEHPTVKWYEIERL